MKRPKSAQEAGADFANTPEPDIFHKRALCPAPAPSHVACGFPALRVPARFTTRVVEPIGTGRLARRAVNSPLDTLGRARAFHAAIPSDRRCNPAWLDVAWLNGMPLLQTDSSRVFSDSRHLRLPTPWPIWFRGQKSSGWRFTEFRSDFYLFL
jgi:hypothetical protein